MTGPQIAAAGGMQLDGPISVRFSYRHQYDDARDALERAASDSHNTEPSMTLQEHAEDADINVVLARFGVKDGSVLPALDLAAVNPNYYGDFTNTTDLKSALDAMRDAEQRFMELPAQLRSRFHNNWYELHEWVNDPANLEEAIQLKMLTRPPAPVPPAGTTATPPQTTPNTQA